MPSGTDAKPTGADPSPPIACASCGRPIDAPYFEINRTVVCGPCRGSIEHQLRGGPGSARLARSAAYGLGGAAIGTALYAAFLRFSAYEWSPVAILIGYLVGRLVRKGGGGLGGTAQQMIAVVLTYGSLGMAYFLAGWLDLRPGGGFVPPRITPGELLALLGFAFRMPLLQMKASPIHIAFFGFALWEAWRLNRPRPLVVTGPHPVEGVG